jgi:general secretion pathway protein G
VKMVVDKKGFTLIELMIVVIIIAALAAMVTPSLINRSEEAKERIVRGDLSSLDTALKLYRLDTGAYPTSAQGLDILLLPTGKGPYLEKKPIDPWGGAYRYKCPGAQRVTSFDVFSVGRDGKEGTEDDIGNWQ